MARTVSGVANAPALRAATGAGAALTTVAGACGGAAFTACRITARESPMIETIGKNKIIHRIFMNKPLSLRDGIIPQAVERRHPDDWKYANLPRIVPVVPVRTQKKCKA